MSHLILMRHGESSWNRLNVFTGWVDVPLSSKGIEEALEAGRRIREIPIDIIFTSTLIRAQMTCFLAMSEHIEGKVPVIMHPKEEQLAKWGQIFDEKAKENTIPVFCSWHLNERMYGELQGLNKKETAEKFGKEQVQMWRRSYHTSPPNGESLKKTAERTIPYFEETIVPQLKEGKNVLISAHGNSLRSIIMDLDNLSEEDVVRLEIPTGVPLFYRYEGGKIEKEKDPFPQST